MARIHHAPASALRGHRWGWTALDRALAIAMQVNEELTCSGCGQYVDESHDERSEGWYETREPVCQGCAELERQRRRGGDEKRDGSKTHVIDVRRTEGGEDG